MSTRSYDHMGECRYNSTIIDLGTRWRWEASFTPRPLYPRGQCPRCPLDTRLGELQGQSERCWEGKNLLPLPGIESRSTVPQPNRYPEGPIPVPGLLSQTGIKVFRTTEEKLTRGWRKLHKEELHNSKSSPNFLTMIIQVHITWVGHIVYDRHHKCV
jgi:hypothetical protein